MLGVYTDRNVCATDATIQTACSIRTTYFVRGSDHHYPFAEIYVINGIQNIGISKISGEA